jgi:hypothetical protein
VEHWQIQNQNRKYFKRLIRSLDGFFWSGGLSKSPLQMYCTFRNIFLRGFANHITVTSRCERFVNDLWRACNLTWFSPSLTGPWTTCLLPATRDSGSNPLGGLMWNRDSPVSDVLLQIYEYWEIVISCGKEQKVKWVSCPLKKYCMSRKKNHWWRGLYWTLPSW